MTCKKFEVIAKVSDKISDLPFAIPTYFEDFITREIFNAVLQDRNQIQRALEEISNER